MDFRLDDGQLALRDAIRAFCSRHAHPATIAAREGRPVAPETWVGLADLGVFGMLVPAADGGSGGGAVDAAIVFEQLGAHLVPGPLLWSTITAPLLTEVATGAARVTGLQVASRATPVVIEHATESDVVVFLHEDGVERCAPSELGPATSGTPLDPLTPALAYADIPRGTTIGGPEEARRLHVLGTALAAALLVGAASGALDVARAYALERRQFGVAIGSFQAVKHLLADMYVRVELARSATYAAAAILDDERAGDATTATSAAKLLAGEAGIANARTAVQVLGGMGFTWDMLPHYFLKRAWVLEQAFGTGDVHAQRLSRALAAELDPPKLDSAQSAWT